MAKIISVVVSGNPASNSGFNKLVLFNNPAFDIPDKFYGGFEACPHFYTIQMTPTHTIFKLVKNNVRSHGAVRPGSLAIAFSIPKNHKLDNGYTPYDVLEDLKKVFLEKCMTCKDPVRETYEFNSPFVDQTVLDQTAAKYTVSPVQLPERTMKATGPVGYVVKTEAEIISLFNDYHYTEFSNYSEVIIADAVNQTSYVAIPNLPVPRVKVYDVYVDGVHKESVSAVDKMITVLSPKPAEYYDCKPLTFSIRQLRENGILGVELLDTQERINVSTEGLATPKKIKYQIKFASHDITKYFQDNSNQIDVIGKLGRVPVKNLEFILTGENNAEVKLGTISVRIQPSSKYTLNTYRFEGNMLNVMVDEKKTYHGSSVTTGGGGRTPDTASPVYEVKIQLNERFRFGNDKNTLRIKLKGAGEILSSSQIRFAHNTKEKLFEGTFLIPKASVSRVSNPCLCFSTKTHEYSYNIVNLLKGDQCIVSERHFKVQKIGFFARFKRPLVLLMASLILLALGGLVGYTAAGGFREAPAGETKKDTTVNVSEAPVKEMTEEDAKAFAIDAREKLKKDETSFDDIEKLYKCYSNNAAIFQKGAYEDELEMIEAYYALVGCIRSGNYNEIKNKSANVGGPCFSISDNHLKIVQNLDKDKFVANYKNVKSLKDLKEKCGKVSEQPAKSGKQKCTKCLKDFDNIQEHEINCNIYACPHCGAGTNWNTQALLNAHLENKHGVTRTNSTQGAGGASPSPVATVDPSKQER